MARREGPTPTGPDRRPLVVAAAIAGLEAVILVLFGFAEVSNLSASRATMGLSTSLFFILYGGGLAACAWLVTRGRAWARSPIVLAQLIQLGLAWSFRGGATTPLAITMAVVAVIVLAGLLHPGSFAALDDDR